MSERLPDGWGPSTPRNDTLTREFIEAYADLVEALGTSAGNATARTEDFVALDSHSPFPFLNLAVPLRPIVDTADPMLDDITGFFAPDDESTPFLIYNATPMPWLGERGWELMGHPPLMLRPAGPATVPTPPGLEIVEVRDDGMLEQFDRTMAEAYPVPEIQGRRSFHAGLLELPGWHMWLGMIDGEPVGTSAAHVSDTLVDVEWISAMPSARGKRVGEALTWAATCVQPDLPAMLIASDLGQPVYERMGYLRLSRFTLWIGKRA
ncbi:MAG: N-acetyltransferase [Acidimicrobiia bacterium]